jgi:hypothetical protein
MRFIKAILIWIAAAWVACVDAFAKRLKVGQNRIAAR